MIPEGSVFPHLTRKLSEHSLANLISYNSSLQLCRYIICFNLYLNLIIKRLLLNYLFLLLVYVIIGTKLQISNTVDSDPYIYASNSL